MATAVGAVGQEPVSRRDRLGSRGRQGGHCLLDRSVDSEEVLREGNVVGWASGRHCGGVVCSW